MFLSLFNAASSDRSPFGDFWFEPIGGRSSSGMRVSADSALRLSAVWACVRILSETLASMPFCMYRYKPNGGKQFITDHPIARLFNKAPNAFQTPFEWRELLQAHLALRGNAYNQIITDRTGKNDPGKLPAPTPDASRLQTLMLANAGRLARRMVKAGVANTTPELIAESLCVPVAAAAEWLADCSPDLTEYQLTNMLFHLGRHANET